MGAAIQTIVAAVAAAAILVLVAVVLYVALRGRDDD
jgi:hypothetical protein